MSDLTQLVHTCAACWVGKKTENTLCDAVCYMQYFVYVCKRNIDIKSEKNIFISTHALVFVQCVCDCYQT